MTVASRRLTPTPPPRNRTGTFDGLDKLFFDRAAAIEAGELTAPPEAPSGLPVRLKAFAAALRARPFAHKVGFGAGLGAVLLASLLLLAPQAKSSSGPLPAPAQPQQPEQPRGTIGNSAQPAVPVARSAPSGESSNSKPGVAKRRSRTSKRAMGLSSSPDRTEAKATRSRPVGRSKSRVKPLDPFN